jgi:hypothetical protein
VDFLAESASLVAMPIDYAAFFSKVTKRYGLTDPTLLEGVLCPHLIPIADLDKTIERYKGGEGKGGGHYRAFFKVKIEDSCCVVLVPGCTGKFVPKAYAGGNGGEWREIAKGRILEMDEAAGIAIGEVYTGASSRKMLEVALDQLHTNDFWEVDQYGASAKILSAIVEQAFVRNVQLAGYSVLRMPQDIARHIGSYLDYDFQVKKGGVMKRVEVKSLWGTDTRYCRLIHSLGQRYETSSCKFDTQDIFAVNLFLRTGKIDDFAFARSISEHEKSYGLPTRKPILSTCTKTPCVISIAGNGSGPSTKCGS